MVIPELHQRWPYSPPFFQDIQTFMPWFVATKAHNGSGIIATITTSNNMNFFGISRLDGTPWIGLTIIMIGGSQRIWIESS
jgi:hypothetical protein